MRGEGGSNIPTRDLARVVAAQHGVELRAARAVQELARPHAAEHLGDGRLHVVEYYRLPARVEVVDQRLDALHIVYVRR